VERDAPSSRVPFGGGVFFFFKLTTLSFAFGMVNEERERISLALPLACLVSTVGGGGTFPLNKKRTNFFSPRDSTFLFSFAGNFKGYSIRLIFPPNSNSSFNNNKLLFFFFFPVTVDFSFPA